MINISFLLIVPNTSIDRYFESILTFISSLFMNKIKIILKGFGNIDDWSYICSQLESYVENIET